MHCIPVASAREILQHVDESCDVVAIDEVQFFSDEIIDVCRTLVGRGKRVIAAGLDQTLGASRLALCRSCLLLQMRSQS